ncbi:MAG: hypothetical protein QF902_04705 [Rhodospirillales bacterium]|nr:hypothetical protein [Rhodospirillales bacterium]
MSDQTKDGSGPPSGEPARRPASDRVTLIVLSALAAVGGTAVYLLQGSDSVVRSLRGDVDLIVLMIPRLAAGVLVGGFIQVLIPKGLAAKWLGEGIGLRGMLLATFAGFCTPGGPMLSFPIVVALRAAGAGIPALVTYITAWSLLGVHRILQWEIPLFGPEFAAVRFIASLPFPIVAGLIAAALAARMRQV